MSWLARSIANSLNLDDDEDDAVPSDHHHHHRERDSLSSSAEDPHHRSSPKNIDCDEDRPNFIDCDEDRPNYIDVDEDRDQGRGVKEDLSEIKDGLTRQFWGVASFLAPPPPPPPPPPPRSQKSESESKSEFVGTDNEDEEELGEISYVSQPEDQNDDDDDDSIGRLVEEAVGITEEVLAFAMNIAHHPETWLDFPCSEEEEFDDFDISDAQYKHALAVEHLAPRLSALRIELCPAHMSDGYFWMVYFVLLHPRLNKHDAELLSTPQVVQARAMWMKELQNQTKEESGWLGASTFHSKDSAHSSPRDTFIVHPPNEDSPSDRTSRFESTLHHMTTHHDMEHRYYEIEFVDKSVIREDPSPMLQEKEVILTPLIEKRVQQEIVACDDDDDDYWLKEDSDLVRLSNASMLVNEEDISFSDLEDDDIDCTMPIKSKIASTGWNVTAKTL